SHPGIAARLAVAAELLKVDLAELIAGLLGELAYGRLRQVLGASSLRRAARPDESSRQCPLSGERRPAALHEQHLQATVPDRQRDDVHGHRDRVVGPWVVGREELLLGHRLSQRSLLRTSYPSPDENISP